MESIFNIDLNIRDVTGADRSEDSFWRQIMEDFNNGTYQGARTKNTITGKWCRINGDSQKFNAIYKHLERKSGKNDVDYIETAKTNFMAQSNGRKFLLEHACRANYKQPHLHTRRKEKELTYTKCKELEFLMIDPDSLPETKTTIIQRKQ
ncbi:hypothetical protein Tco_0041295 [Tanacetum coccineum]